MLNIGIQYTTGDENIYNKLKPNIYMTLDEFFSEIYGLKIYYVDNVYEFGKNDIKIAKLDAFECPWNIAYHKNHIDHYVIIDSICREKGYIICKDSYLGMHDIKCDINHFVKSVVNLRAIKGNIILKKEGNYVLESYIKRNSKKEIFEKYNLLINDFDLVKKIEECFECSDVMNCKLIISAKQIENNWRGVCEYINVNNYSKESFVVARECVGRWSKIVLNLIKCQLRNSWSDIDKNNISSNLKICCQLEASIYDKFVEEYVRINH